MSGRRPTSWSVAIEGLIATVTFTDVHPARIAFCHDMSARFIVDWSLSEHRGGGIDWGEHHRVTARFEARGRDALESPRPSRTGGLPRPFGLAAGVPD